MRLHHLCFDFLKCGRNFNKSYLGMYPIVLYLDKMPNVCQTSMCMDLDSLKAHFQKPK
jgi:hypothetical protein